MDELLSYLNSYYNKFKCPEGSLIKQIKDVAKIIDLDPFTEDAKVCVDELDQFYVSKITQTDKAELYRKIVHLCDLFSKDQVNYELDKDVNDCDNINEKSDDDEGTIAKSQSKQNGAMSSDTEPD
ncbi:unnamed protein product [Brachionus calyciflorus]|uniref:Uncharacterized protein n=1 Tax=Brachionus calyciflorus TaxID=104777 RepID=A0A813X8E3_9BILA|nr:unnamed protein product [Brachionus calyciflorus]